jgi:hypothetical protein
MEVNFALLAEHVSEGSDGKISVVGIFDQIWTTSSYLTFPRMFAAIRLHASVVEGSEHAIELVIVDDDGHAVLPKSPPIPVSFFPSGPGRPMRGQVVAQFDAIRFPRFGDYELNVFVDGRPLASVPFSVSELERRG